MGCGTDAKAASGAVFTGAAARAMGSGYRTSARIPARTPMLECGGITTARTGAAANAGYGVDRNIALTPSSDNRFQFVRVFRNGG